MPAECQTVFWPGHGTSRYVCALPAGHPDPTGDGGHSIQPVMPCPAPADHLIAEAARAYAHAWATPCACHPDEPRPCRHETDLDAAQTHLISLVTGN